MSLALTYRSYAKINLYLDVLEERKDGFHNIETIFQTIDLGDDLSFEERHSRVSLSSESKDIDTGEENLVHRAAMALRKRCGYRQGARIELLKRIPVAAGLAGGSGNAGTTLVALNRMWDLGLSKEDLLEVALELGSDVPYCTIGGTMAATSRGEELIPLKPLAATWFVLLHPPYTISTARVYNHPKLKASRPAQKTGAPRFTKALEALEKNDLPAVLYNRLETIVFDDQPQLAKLKEGLIERGCTAAAMSGSGPTLFGVCLSKQHAKKIAATYETMETSVVRTVDTAVERI